MRLLLVAMTALLSACASQVPAPAPAPSSPPPAVAPSKPTAPAVEMAEAPYTLAQIRDACPSGRRLVFKVQEPDKPDVQRVIEFVRSDANGAEIRTSSIDTTGHLLEATTTRSTWEELRAHAEFPKDQVEISHRTVSIPVGTLACTVYKVTQGQGSEAEVTTYYFSEKTAGPPVFFFVEKGGKRTRSSTMESSSDPK
jgi:hypothetical protein